MKIFKKILIWGCIPLFLLFLLTSSFINTHKPPINRSNGPLLNTNDPMSKAYKPVIQDPVLKELLKEWGINDNSVNLKYGVSEKSPTANGYYTNGTILVKPGLSPRAQLFVVAHEYTHYWWQKFNIPLSNSSEENLLFSELDSLSGDKVARVLSTYGHCDTNKWCYRFEKLAFSCSVFYNNELGPRTIKACNEILPNRENILQKHKPRW